MSVCGLPALAPAPLERCPACGGATGFELVSGCGRIKSFIVVRHPAVPGYLEDLPYVVAIVDLDEQEGLRLPGRLLDADPARVDVGRAVRAEIVDLPGATSVLWPSAWPARRLIRGSARCSNGWAAFTPRSASGRRR